jgi:hypothetical protein
MFEWLMFLAPYGALAFIFYWIGRIRSKLRYQKKYSFYTLNPSSTAHSEQQRLLLLAQKAITPVVQKVSNDLQEAKLGELSLDVYQQNGSASSLFINFSPLSSCFDQELWNTRFPVLELSLNFGRPTKEIRLFESDTAEESYFLRTELDIAIEHAGACIKTVPQLNNPSRFVRT